MTGFIATLLILSATIIGFAGMFFNWDSDILSFTCMFLFVAGFGMYIKDLWNNGGKD